MADQVTANQPSVETPTVMSAEEKKQYIIAKVKEIFEKENFKKNFQNLVDHIYDPSVNSIYLDYILRELKVIEKGIDEQTITEAFNSDDLKESIVYLEKLRVIRPTWRRLRNILYIKGDKTVSSQIKTYLQENITIPGIVFTIDIIQEESVKITVATPGKEEEHTKLIFSQLFQKTVKLADEKEFTFNCAIEEEQFSLPPNFSSHRQVKTHQFIPSQSVMNQQFSLEQYQLFQMAMQSQQQMYQNQRNYPKKGGPREQRGFPAQGAGAYSTRTGGVSAPMINVVNSGNDLQKSAHNGQQNHHQGNNRGGQNNTGNRNNKPRRDGGSKPTVKGPGGKHSQRLFNASDKDFPTLA